MLYIHNYEIKLHNCNLITNLPILIRHGDLKMTRLCAHLSPNIKLLLTKKTLATMTNE